MVCRPPDEPVLAAAKEEIGSFTDQDDRAERPARNASSPSPRAAKPDDCISSNSWLLRISLPG
jgi:hypothetical protein